jgi:hypothetical protein
MMFRGRGVFAAGREGATGRPVKRVAGAQQGRTLAACIDVESAIVDWHVQDRAESSDGGDNRMK